MLGTFLRRTLKAAVVGGLAVVVAVWFRQRNDTAEELDPGPAEWPPLRPAPAASDESPVIAEPSDGSAAPAPAGDWVDPDPEGDCPLSHPVKAKLRSGIYHVPGGASYERTNADRCYPTPESAETDGYRASKT